MPNNLNEVSLARWIYCLPWVLILLFLSVLSLVFSILKYVCVLVTRHISRLSDVLGKYINTILGINYY